MNFRLIANTTSYVLWVEAGFLLLPLAASVLYGEAWLPFFGTGGAVHPAGHGAASGAGKKGADAQPRRLYGRGAGLDRPVPHRCAALCVHRAR